ncbi:HopJ type III effector protein [Pontibacter sp. JAM-7]|uniref:HopJ type III effector protein n=1 Tax=Pontibacter sp. JAM-7 TaxID=3366581 RepID=UPI003AF50906
MTPEAFVTALKNGDTLDFEDTMSVIEQHFLYQPTAFRNGELENAAGQNEGSCKIFAFAKLMQLDEQTTLRCFGRFYQDVMATPDGSDHGNIRNFMQSGWSGIIFSNTALTSKG